MQVRGMDAIFRACVILKVASEDSARVGGTGGFQGAWHGRESTDARKSMASSHYSKVFTVGYWRSSLHGTSIRRRREERTTNYVRRVQPIEAKRPVPRPPMIEGIRP